MTFRKRALGRLRSSPDRRESSNALRWRRSRGGRERCLAFQRRLPWPSALWPCRPSAPFQCGHASKKRRRSAVFLFAAALRPAYLHHLRPDLDFTTAMKTIANLGSMEQAQSLKRRLESAGIGAFIPDEMSATIAPHFFMTRVGIRLQVDERDEEEARLILDHGFDEIGSLPDDAPA